jgi:acyl carrier protein
MAPLEGTVRSPSTRVHLLGACRTCLRLLGDSMKLLRPIIISHIEQIATEQKQPLAPLVDDLLLADSGLDSLSFAILVARLEDELGLDPFSASTDTHYPITLGDFVKFYEDANHIR